MKSYLLLFLISILFFAQQGYGQSYNKKQNYVWTFGDNMKLDFNSNPPVATPGSVQPLNFGVGTVCDANGNLLFYTDGDNFFDRDNNVMPNGNDVTGQAFLANGISYFSPTVNSYHGAQIIPMPGNPHKYYVFMVVGISTTLLPLPKYGYLYYSIVDMTLNGGLGDIAPGKRGIILDTGMGAPLAGVVGDDCNYWLIAHSLDTNAFKAYAITDTGISQTPIVSQTGSSAPDLPLVIILSSDRQKLMLGSAYNTEVFGFDPSTGMIGSSSIQLGIGTLDAAFSPDGTKVYTGSGGYPIYQFDLSSATPTAFTIVTPIIPWFGMRLGPDGRIYTSGTFSESGFGIYNITIINHPNLAGAACDYDSVGLQQWSPGGYFLSLLPSEVPVLIPDTAATSQQVFLCYQSIVQLQAIDTSGVEYLWQDSIAGDKRTTDTPGIYIVSYSTYKPCVYHSDTFSVIPVGDITPNIGNDTAICDSATYVLQAFVPGVNYLWSTGSTGNSCVADTTGNYWVQVSKDGCTASDSAHVRFINLRQDLGDDTAVCSGTPIQMQLAANVPDGATAMWSQGSNMDTIVIKDTGTYWVSVSYPPSGCEDDDTIRISTQLCKCHIEMPDAFTPNNDGKNDVFRPIIEPECEISGYLLTVYNRWGQVIFTTTSIGQGWDGKQNGIPADIGTYMYTIQLNAGTEQQRFYQHGDVTLIR